MNPAVIDPHTFDELQANAGADFVLELVDTFAEEAPRLLTELRNALAAGAAERFLGEGVHELEHEVGAGVGLQLVEGVGCLLYTSPSPRD